MSTNYNNVKFVLDNVLFGKLPDPEITRIAQASLNEMQRTIQRLEERLQTFRDAVEEEAKKAGVK